MDLQELPSIIVRLNMFVFEKRVTLISETIGTIGTIELDVVNDISIEQALVNLDYKILG